MKLPFLLIVIVGIIAYMVMPLCIWIFVKNKKIFKRIIITSLILFVIVLIGGITCNISIQEGFVELSYKSYDKWFNKQFNWSIEDIDKVDFLINILMLIPIGISVVALIEKRIWLIILTLVSVGFATGALLELIQFVFPVIRSPQLSDVILNALSVCIGGGVGFIFKSIAGICNRSNK